MSIRNRLACLLLVAVFCLPVVGGQKKAETNLPEQYRLWLEEEVAYIITPTERDVFLKLETDRERDIFIEAFWKHRDPTPGTPQNEFKDEHYKRLKYANEYFSRGTPRPGWMTDRGRIHIILGPPKNIEDFDSINGVYPVQIWAYDGDPQYGLPTGFNILFFKKHGIGEYVLYSPVDDGPESLIADWGTGLTADYMQEDSRRRLGAVQQLAKLAPNLAYQTLSLIPGERPAAGSVSLASTRLLGNVFSYPQKKVEDAYAGALLKYKDIIEVDYSANYIPSDSSLYVIQDEAGRFMVHYSIEPKKISVGSYGDTYSTNYELDGRISDADGNTIFQYMKELPLSFSASEIQDLGAKALAIQDLFPLVPGTYKFDLLLKNTVSKEFTTFEGTIVIPEEGAPRAMTPLVLGYRLEKGVAAAEFVPFRVRDGQLLTPARKTFSPKENLVVFFQLLGLPPELKSSGRLKYDVLRQDTPFSTKTKTISEYRNAPDFLEVFALQDFPPDYYKIRVSVLDSRGAELLTRDEDFEITAAPSIGRPLVVSKVTPVSAAEEYDYEMGLQWLNLRRNREAGIYLEKAYAKNPDQLKFALGLCQCLFIDGQYQRIKDILTPWMGEKATDWVLYFHGKSAHSLNQLDEAIADYTTYLSRFGLNLEILNLLGTAHYQKGNAAEALRAWKRSLEINPDQENIRKLVQSLEDSLKR